MVLRLPPVQPGGAMTALFEAGPYRAFELGADDIPRLQRFYDENPEYHQAVEGVHPGADTAREEFHSLPPPGWPFTRPRSGTSVSSSSRHTSTEAARLIACTRRSRPG